MAQSTADLSPSPTWIGRIRDRAEEWIYRLNEQNHWFFRLYDRANELWSRLVFRGVRGRASAIDEELDARGQKGRFRFLTPEDLDLFAELLDRFDFEYLPPHAIDRDGAFATLRRHSHLPFGIFHEGRLIGYVLIRLFFFRRAVSGIWSLPSHHNQGFNVAAVRASGRFTKSERLPDYATVPIGNDPSLLGAQAAGWKIIRTNRRFHVLLR